MGGPERGHRQGMTEQPNDADTTNDTDSDPDVMNPKDLRGETARDEVAEGNGDPGTDDDADPENLNPRD